MNNSERIFCKALIAMGFATLLFLATLYSHIKPRLSEKGNDTKAISNCRQIITALHAYAADHDGKYPDALLANPQSSNEVFRVLIKEQTTDNEQIFGSPVSPYIPDGNIGYGPDHAKALEPDENHWAMTAALTLDMPGQIPLVYENPVTASWPPTWNASAKGTNTRGRTWKTSVIIGLNDGSVSFRKIESKSGTSVRLAKERDGKDIFEAAIDPVKFPRGVVLDVLRNGE